MIVLDYEDFLVLKEIDKYYAIDLQDNTWEEVEPIKVIDRRENPYEYDAMNYGDPACLCEEPYDYSGEEITDDTCKYWFFRAVAKWETKYLNKRFTKK